MVSTRDAYFSSDYEFNTQHGFQVAFALTNYDDNQNPIDDKTYGQVKAYYKTWGLTDVKGVSFEEINNDYCTME